MRIYLFPEDFLPRTNTNHHKKYPQAGKMMVGNKIGKLVWFVVSFFFFFALLFVPGVIFAQEDFGFGDSDSDFGFGGSSFGFSDSPKFSVGIGGNVSSEFTFFYDDMGPNGGFEKIKLGDIFSGSLNFSAGASFAQAVINLNLFPVFDGSSSPVEIDEAYLRAFFGPVTVTGGLRKLTWGKADSFGPLDVINPIDYTDLTRLSDPKGVKLARPMIHTAFTLGSFSKLEAVFVPWFQGHSFATAGRWAPAQINDLRAGIEETLGKTAIGIQQMIPGVLTPTEANALLTVITQLGASLEDSLEDSDLYPKTDLLEYAQGGLRFTTSIGSSDLGLQYYFGRLPRPAITGFNPTVFFTPAGIPTVADIHAEAITPDIDYNYYHHIGADFVRVIAGFNIRAEFGANITSDTNGNDGEVENPALVWSLGFDRDLFWGINLNLQGTGKIRLLHSKIGGLFEDCEAGTKVSSTRITGILSKSFLRDELELKATALWGIEDRDFLIMPALSWERNDVCAEISTGFFGGKKSGELGQYRNNSFLRLTLSYSF